MKVLRQELMKRSGRQDLPTLLWKLCYAGGTRDGRGTEAATHRGFPTRPIAVSDVTICCILDI